MFPVDHGSPLTVQHDGHLLHRPNTYSSEDGQDGFDFSRIDFPVKLNQISKIEQQNNLAINAFAWETNRVLPVYGSEKPEG